MKTAMLLTHNQVIKGSDLISLLLILAQLTVETIPSADLAFLKGSDKPSSLIPASDVQRKGLPPRCGA